MKYLLLLTLLITTLAFSAENSIKTEYELKLALTDKGYKKFKKFFKDDYQAEESERTDLYYDIFSAKHFVLKNLTDPVKLRFQDSKWQVQKSHALEGLGDLAAKASTSLNIESDEKDVKRISKKMEDYFQELQDKNPKALETAKDIREELVDLKLFKKAANVCSQCTNDQNYFPLQTNTKKRTKISLKEKGFEFSLFVGATTNKNEVSYEMEAELKNSDDVKSALPVLLNWLKAHELKEEDILKTTPVDQTIKDEDILTRLGAEAI